MCVVHSASVQLSRMPITIHVTASHYLYRYSPSWLVFNL